MRKIIVLAVLAVLFAVMGPMAPKVHAVGIPLPITDPVVIGPGGGVTIIVSNIGGTPFTVLAWHVTRPDDTQDDVHPAGEIIISNTSVSHTYPADFGGDTSQPGLYTVHFHIWDGMTYEVPGVSFVVIIPCFIATAAYGTPMAEQVDVLRDFRNQYLITNPVGEALVEFYYKVSPPMAEFITKHPALKPVVRAALVPAVAASRVAVNTTFPQKVAILASLGLLSVSVALWLRHRSLGMRRS